MLVALVFRNISKLIHREVQVMSNNGGEEAVRPRPLSGGLWTLFSWLRRDERASSSDSLSSAGSDKTAISFSFLQPVDYRARAHPLLLPPPGPPTDSYKKRVTERNRRRQNDRNITLHRKYGLYRSDAPSGYDACSLPPSRRINNNSSSQWERERRATSECFQRRIVHVPGKRRAPLPPTSNCPAAASLAVRRTRKRPAPQPPVNCLQKIAEHNKLVVGKAIDMNNQPQASQVPQSTTNIDISMGCKQEKYSKKDTPSKQTKGRSEKSFLKQIFENKKRSSIIETASIKVLPSISELDQQAAEIIKSNKQNCPHKNDVGYNNLSDKKNIESINSSQCEYWFCIKCLRKYDLSTRECSYCIQTPKSDSSTVLESKPPNNSPLNESIHTQTENTLRETTSPCVINQHCEVENKQKLKDMLKEMKDSLPKRPKNKVNGSDIIKIENSVTTAPTLRIGTMLNEELTNSLKDNDPKMKNSSLLEIKKDVHNNEFKIKQMVLEKIVSASNKDIPIVNKQKFSISNHVSGNVRQLEKQKTNLETNKISDRKDELKLNTPLKISSLLNPIHIPRENSVEKPPVNILPQTKLKKIEINNESAVEAELTKKIPHVLTTPANFLPKTGAVLLAQPDKINSAEKQLVSMNDNTNNKSFLHISTENSSNNVIGNSGNDCGDKSNIQPANNNSKGSKYNISTEKESEKSTKAFVKYNKFDTSNDIIHNKISSNNQTSVKSILTDERIKGSTQDSAVSVDLKKEKTTNLIPTKNILHTTASKDPHSQRRALINKLEQSIAKGDESGAAAAAAKLAKLRLSCSVLSFSSQIMAGPSTSNSTENKIISEKVVPEKPSLNTQNTSVPISKINGTSFSSETGHKEPAPKIKEKIIQKPSMIETNSPAPVKGPTQTSSQTAISMLEDDEYVSIKVWVEDRETARGPIYLRVLKLSTFGYLRIVAEVDLGIPRHLQRWIVGKRLCTCDNVLLEKIAGEDFSAPFYLCLVEAEINIDRMQDVREYIQQKMNTIKKNAKDAQRKDANFYTELVEIEQQALVVNAEEFECGICLGENTAGTGVVLRGCGVHTFCRECLVILVQKTEEPIIKCPAFRCGGILEEREIRALMSPEEYDRWLMRGLNAAESGTKNSFHCRTRDCNGWALCEPGVQIFPCPVCKHANCVPCQAIHENETCEEFKMKLKAAADSTEGNNIDEETKALLNSLIKRGEALECPDCKSIITKKWGCDWIKCFACKTEICWVTRGRRWGPAGRGDTSGGCRCGVDGKRCHPTCGYCH